LGFAYGLMKAGLLIINSNYLSYQLYNLILFDIQSNITKYSIAFVIISLIAYLCFIIVKRLSGIKFLKLNKLDSKQFTALIFLINLLLLYAVICLVFYDDIIFYLKTIPINPFFGNYIKHPMAVFRILKNVFIPASFLFLVTLTYIFLRLNLIEPIKNKLMKLIDSRQNQHIGLITFVLLISFNTFMLVYKNLNKPEGPNVILITIDTLRADHLGSYGYERDTSPNIDSLAEKGILFENAFSQAPWTLPSMASMHTSLYPTQIGILKFGYQINDKLLMIAEYMKNNFYNTFAVVSNIVVGKILGFGQGFDLFEETINSYEGGYDSRIITDKAIQIIQNNKDNRFFLWVHYMDPHDHYIRHSEFNYGSEYAGSLPSEVNTRYLNKNKDPLDINDLSYVKDLYDGEISYTDKYIGELINSLSELGIEENTIIILTADHGEGFMERGKFGHGQNLYQELINVPLVIYNPLEPKLSGKRVTNNVEVRYIAKTIFELTNLNNSYIEGYNLLDIDHENSSDGIVYSQLHKNLKAVLVNDWKLISNSENNIFELYNLKEDPNELSNQFTSNREDITQVRDMLAAKLLYLNNLKTTEIKKIKLEEEDIKKLKALGYLQ